MVERVYVVNNDIEWTGDEVLHLIYILKDVPALYVNWIYVVRSRVRVSCVCMLAHQLFAAQVAVQTPTLQPLAYLRSMIASTLTDTCINFANCTCIFWLAVASGKQNTTDSSSL